MAKLQTLPIDTRRKQADLIVRLKKCWPLYIFLLIPVGYLLLFQYYPMYGAQIAFKDYKANLGIINSPWVGLKHFEKFFDSYEFWRILKNTLLLSFYSLFASFPIRIFLALSINATRSNGFRKGTQMITYMPHFISTVVLVGIVVQFLNPRIGILLRIVQQLGGNNVGCMLSTC